MLGVIDALAGGCMALDTGSKTYGFSGKVLVHANDERGARRKIEILQNILEAVFSENEVSLSIDTDAVLHITLRAERWEDFVHSLNRPPRELSGLKKLFARRN